jgi:hypothetical protein
VKGKRPMMLVNKSIINESKKAIIEGKYVLISPDMWFFFKNWYGADFKVEVQYLSEKNH